MIPVLSLGMVKESVGRSGGAAGLIPGPTSGIPAPGHIPSPIHPGPAGVAHAPALAPMPLGVFNQE
jgi:hypothetical protein